MTPQITFFLVAGALHAEAPGTNGTRRKIDLPLGFTLPAELAADLAAQADKIRATERAKISACQAANIQYVAQRHNLELAAKIWNGQTAFGHALKRLERVTPTKEDAEIINLLKL